MSDKSFFGKDVDMESKESMINFLTNHFRYYTMNSWNRSTSYANNVKLYNLDIPKELKDKAYEVTCGDVDTSSFSNAVDELIVNFRYETGYDAGFNGRSGGYLVMYEGRKVVDEHKSFCPSCGQKNYEVATEGHDKCGRCGAKRINYNGTAYRWETYPGISVGTDDPAEWEDTSMEELRDEVELVQKFDRLCDDIREIFIYTLGSSEIVEETYTAVKIRRILKEIEE